ncbi:cytochrome c biogenesis protein DipZ [Candidatus Roizmanbacteria bacterium]|nr:cytochrome c biogenesis protein DipZ [Candidatus Roizmanbacteria bacterium]
MIILISFSFLAGIVTILSPCILPILPVVLSGVVGEGKKRPLGIVSGFILSFTFFTLLLSAIVKQIGISADVLRNISVFVIFGFGLSMLVPSLKIIMERFFSRLSGNVSTNNKGGGFLGGLLIGLSLGLIWTPCVGPILASIITLAASNTVNSATVLITFAYSLGTAIPMLLIMQGGKSLINKVPWLLPNAGKIQRAFGVLMMLTALAIYFNVDRKFQTYILEKFPNYGVGLTKIEDNQSVKEQLKKLKSENEKDLLSNLKNSFYPVAPELIKGGQWFNSQPLTISSLKGKVILVDFWTYTCINCIRTLPYLKSWYEKYKDKGLVIIGVHTPEFEFEKNPDNVAKAIKDFSIKYPIMQDNDYATWRAYNNHYWPAKYFIDRDGKIRSSHFGEGEYDESEKLIQELLKEIGKLKEDMVIDNPTYNVEARTPETYLGYNRRIDDGNLTYSGSWKIMEELALPSKGAGLEFNFEAKNVFLVMGSKNKIPGKVKIYLDEKFIEEIEINSYRLYDLIKLSQPGKHILRLEFLDSNLELYAFTFG